LPQACEAGTFVAPTAVEIDGIARLEREVFGPVLHVVRYSAKALDQVIDDINATGFGLTLGIHSRWMPRPAISPRACASAIPTSIATRWGRWLAYSRSAGRACRVRGPKAGGPHYLHRFATERVVSVDTTAAGGNASLFAMEDDA
jgi:RHH-type transcriptional regulator, proline utilization regulon repressor / proline dehydrogenase / delta 1-pyrroline-5-carboxylate dehydrogenase